MNKNKTQGFPLTRRRRQMEESAEILAVLLVCGSVLAVGAMTLFMVWMLS